MGRNDTFDGGVCVDRIAVQTAAFGAAAMVGFWCWLRQIHVLENERSTHKIKAEAMAKMTVKYPPNYGKQHIALTRNGKGVRATGYRASDNIPMKLQPHCCRPWLFPIFVRGEAS